MSVRIQTIPTTKLVQSTQPCDAFAGRPKRKVIGIAQDDLSSGIAYLLNGQTFDRPLRADRHEGGGLHHAMREMQPATSRRGRPIRYKKLERKSFPLELP